MTAIGKGFGCRPGASVAPVRGPASESLRRTNPRESGKDLPVYGDLARRRLCRGMILARSLRAESRLRLWIDRCCRARRPDRGLLGDALAAFAGAGMKRVRCRERNVPANGCGGERTRIVIGSRPDPGTGGRAARCGAARKDLDDDHAAAAARARRAMIGRGVWIGGVVVTRCRRLDRRHWGVHQLPGTRDVGFAAGAGQQSVVANAMEAFRQNVEQEAADEFVRAEPRWRSAPSRR